VNGRDAIWDQSPSQPIVRGLDDEMREVLVTRALDAEPDHRDEMPQPSSWPFWAAIAVTGMFIGSIFAPSAVAWGAIPIAIALIGWFWPNRKQSEQSRAREKWAA
jgi:cytochrome c oxidase subunit 1